MEYIYINIYSIPSTPPVMLIFKTLQSKIGTREQRSQRVGVLHNGYFA